jgi:hypothetical protein
MNPPGTPIALPLRLWLAVEVLFGAAAVLAIGVDPANSANNFAWNIQPVVMAAALGAFYISSAPLFLLPMFARRWEMIRCMALPAAMFCLIQLAATFLHWDKFSVGTLPFYVWFASYLLPPPIFIAAYLWHQRRAKTAAPDAAEPIPGWLRGLLIGCGVILAAIAAAAFLAPALLTDRFAWQLTPLTARSLSGWLAAVGTLMLGMARENHRTRARLASPMLIVLLPAMLLQMSRFAGQVAWGSPALWLGLGLLGVAGFCGLALARGSWRAALR